MPTQAELGRMAEKCLGAMKLVSFNASPSTILPFKESTLNWNVNRTQIIGCMVHVELNGQTVTLKGSRKVGAGTYVLTAHALFELPGDGLQARKTKSLGTVAVVSDTTACIVGAIPEEIVRQMVQIQVFSQFPQGGKVVVRKPASVEVDRSGINVSLKLKRVIDNFADLDVDVAFRFTLRSVDGNAVVNVDSVSVDVHWPLWVTAVSAGVSGIVEELIEKQIKNGLKSKIQVGIQQLLDDKAKLLQGFGFFKLSTDVDAIAFTLCPKV